jgi:S-DNA-T family DNA segregation ATPase FtsK/SpoIIIE
MGIKDIIQHQKFKEAQGILLMALAFYLLVSLLTYNPLDSSLNVASGSISNYGGRLGAILADLSYQLLGIAALLLPFLLFWWGQSSFRLVEMAHPLLRTVGAVLLLWGTGYLAGLISGPYKTDLLLFELDHAGGLWGEEMAFWSQGYLGVWGAYLAAAVLIILGWAFITPKSLAFIGIGGINLMAYPLVKLGEVWKRRRENRAGRRHKTVGSVDEDIKEPSPPAPLGPSLGARPLPGGEGGYEVSFSSPRPSGEGLGVREEVELEGKEGAAPQSAFDFARTPTSYQLPPISLLDAPPAQTVKVSSQEIAENSALLERTLKEFGVEARVVAVQPGPVITRYELEPAPGVKVVRIVTLADDLALALRALSVRIVAPIPGKAVVGVEIPNYQRRTVYLKEILAAEKFQKMAGARHSVSLQVALGKDIGGEPYIADLTAMPHLLVAGATGSGKSVAINAMILSILFAARPQEVKFILVDPKRVELAPYNGLMHLLCPVINDPKEAAQALRWAVGHMEDRYRLLAAKGSRNLASYNRLVQNQPLRQREAEGLESLPYVVIVIDELADLMATAPAEVEDSVARLAQMARAVGMHLIIATQRPSVDVITGIIKANFPARLAFQVSSKVDSRTILDVNGAESLLGQGDMLFMPPSTNKPLRLHGAWVSEVEVKRVVNFISRFGSPQYDRHITHIKKEKVDTDDIPDELYERAVSLVIDMQEASISKIQRKLRVGYNRAARMIEMMEQDGIISTADGVRPRKVLKNKEEWRREDRLI